MQLLEMGPTVRISFLRQPYYISCRHQPPGGNYNVLVIYTYNASHDYAKFCCYFGISDTLGAYFMLRYLGLCVNFSAILVFLRPRSLDREEYHVDLEIYQSPLASCKRVWTGFYKNNYIAFIFL